MRLGAGPERVRTERDTIMASSSAVLDTAFSEVAEVLGSDGFTSAWTVDQEGLVSFVIGAGEAACAECLVPKPVLEAMLTSALEGSGYRLGEIRVPADLAGQPVE